MKKLWMIAIAGVFFFASCANKTAQVEPETDGQETEQCCQLTDEQKADLAAWEDWANQTDEQKVELIAKMKACFDQKMAENAENCEGVQEEVCPEKAAKCAEFKAKWESWETLTIDEQKELIDAKMNCCKAKCEAKEGCTKEEVVE